MFNELQSAFNEIAETRALPADVVLEALQSALVSAYRRDSGASTAQNIEARIDPATGRARIFVEKEVTENHNLFQVIYAPFVACHRICFKKTQTKM